MRAPYRSRVAGAAGGRTRVRAALCASASRHDGFTYLFVLFLVALLGVGLATAGEAWESHRYRAAEVELLWTGDQYRRALGAYYRNVAGCGAERNRYPRELAHLVKDPRCPATVRYLRRLYPDPVTGADWVIVRSPDGGIAGVHSASTRRPFKTSGFRTVDRDFEDKKTYREWVFLDALPTGPVRVGPQGAPGSTPSAPMPGTAPGASTIGGSASTPGLAAPGSPTPNAPGAPFFPSPPQTGGSTPLQ
ncbi:MAG: hypothetical protein MUF56_07110 [Solirubrobacteraceae bacterium]|nr:hypothetical protein [Solirubrobacteraceae bacterium]